MGYSLQYCENGCGHAVPGNECDWEDGVCDACREASEVAEDVGWTGMDEVRAERVGGDAGELLAKAVKEIRDLRRRLAFAEGQASVLYPIAEGAVRGPGARLERALTEIASGEAWNARETARYALGIEADEQPKDPANG